MQHDSERTVEGVPVPSLSVVVAFSSSARQADRALYSLSTAFQRNVAPDAYEIVAVEARSDDLLGEERALAHGSNVRYRSVDASPAFRAAALRLGVMQSRSPFFGLFLDGAHIVTPRTLEHALVALRLCERPLVVLPSYCLNDCAYDMAGEQLLLEKLDWKNDCYELFNHARFGPSNPNGAFSPLLGARCLFMPRASYDAVGGADASADRPGGGALGLKLYTELARLPGTRLSVLAGEGAFRQAHPEILADSVRSAEQSVLSLLESYVSPLADFRPVHREPIALGAIPGPAHPFVVESLARTDYHCKVCKQKGEPAWYED